MPETGKSLRRTECQQRPGFRPDADDPWIVSVNGPGAELANKPDPSSGRPEDGI